MPSGQVGVAQPRYALFFLGFFSEKKFAPDVDQGLFSVTIVGGLRKHQVQFIYGGESVFLISPGWLVDAFSGKREAASLHFPTVADCLTQLCESHAGAGGSLSSSSMGDESRSNTSSLASSAGGLSVSNDMLSLSMSMNLFDIDGSIQSQVEEVNSILGGPPAFSLNGDLSLVRFRFSLGNMSWSWDEGRLHALADHFGVHLETQFVIDLSYADGTLQPRASVSILRESRHEKNALVCDWLREIVHHCQDLWSKGDMDALHHYGQNSAADVDSMRQDLALNKIIAKFSTKRSKKDEAGKKLKLQNPLEDDSRFISPGGLFWNNDLGPLANPELIGTLREMGFTPTEISKVWTGKETLEAIVQHLSESFPDDTPVVQQLLSEGYPRKEVLNALSGCGNDAGKAEVILEAKFESKKTPLPNTKNFYLVLVEYLVERLRNFKRYCFVCGAAHNCNSSEAVVCPSALCVFRWEELGLHRLFPQAKQCVFDNCGCTNWARKCIAYFGDSLANVSKKYGLSESMVLEMAFHKYLPKDEMLKFFAVIKQLNAKSVKNCLSPELCVRFERRIAELRDAKRTGEELKPHVAYHGTAPQNVALIAESGFRLDKLAANTGNRGYYGAGVYCSPQANYCVGYTRGGKELLVCAVLMGKRFKCPNMMLGCELQKGFDSHTDPTGNSEWVLFQEESILPCFILQMP